MGNITLKLYAFHVNILQYRTTQFYELEQNSDTNMPTRT
jgi:hypothetical protein